MRHTVLISNASATCGVEEFARQIARRLSDGSRAVPLGDALGPADDVVVNLPVVAWKKRLVAPIAAALDARRRGQGVTIVLHEWADLALARRISYLPLLPLATRIFFSSPEVQAQFEATPLSRVVTKDRAVIAIPPNLSVPQQTQETPISRALADKRSAGTFVLAQFGSIYLNKDPLQLLQVGAELVSRGVDIRIVFIGSFVGDGVEAEFMAEVERLKLVGRVEVTGYVHSSEELYGIFAQVDAFLYPLTEGMTSRRSSVQAAALSGRPVIVTAPARADSLAHHRLLQSLIAAGAIQFVPLRATTSAMADAALATRGLPVRQVDAAREIDGVWREVARAFDA